MNLKPPRYEESGPLLLAGISERYTPATTAGMPAQWQRFVPHLGHIPGQTGSVTYGVVSNTDDGCDYLCGVEVSDFSRLSAEFARLRLPRGRYAVFIHDQHVSCIQATWKAIWNQWTPMASLRIADAPQLERYPEAFNPVTGMGGVEIWIPVGN